MVVSSGSLSRLAARALGVNRVLVLHRAPVERALGGVRQGSNDVKPLGNFDRQAKVLRDGLH